MNMTTRRASINVRGVFTHEQYRHLCDKLDTVGQIYNSMCTEEREVTIASIYLYTDQDKAHLDAMVRAVLHVREVDISIKEDANAEKCN